MVTEIQMMNGMMLVVREKPQGAVNSLILLPTTKYTTSKVGLVLASGAIKHYSGKILESWAQPGERGISHPADRGYEIFAWDDLEFVVPYSSRIKEERLPEGVTIKSEGQSTRTVEVAPGVDAFVSEPAYTRITVRKGTYMQTWLGVGDDIKAIVDPFTEVPD